MIDPMIATPRAVRALVDDKTHHDHALFFNGLLPIMDLTSFICATHIAKTIVMLSTGNVSHSHPFDDRLLMMIAVLAPALLYDRRFIAVASRAQMGALVRCYLTGFSLLTGAMLALIAIVGILPSLPHRQIAIWLALAFGFTALTRVAVAAAVLRCVQKGLLTEVVAIVGASPRADRLTAFLRSAKPVTPLLLGVFDDEPPLTLVDPGLNVTGSNALSASLHNVSGNIDDLIALGKTRRIDWIFLALRHADEEKTASIVHRLKALSVPVALCPPTLAIDPDAKRVDYIADAMPVTLLQYPKQGWPTAIRSIGQFLPRWIVTLTTLTGLLIQAMWSRLRTASPASPTSGTLTCELDNYDLDGFMNVVRDYGQHRFGYVVTPNTDHFVRLHDDSAFRGLYAAAEYVLMDSRFLAKILRLMSGMQLPVCTGSDLTAELFASLAPADRIVIIGGSDPQVAELAARHSLKHVAHHNPPMGFIRDETAVAACVQFIESHSPFRYCLLAVGSPQQEQLARRLQERGIARGLALCVGASIDFLTGVEKRAPLWMQRHAVEWMYRLMQNPKRLAKRYLIRGPRIFWLLRKTKFVLRKRSEPEAVVEKARAA